MRELLADLERLGSAGPVGRAVLVDVTGSSPRRPGATMLATEDGRIAGSVSGGCVESAAAVEIAACIGAGAPRIVTFGVSDDRAWEVGLTCGGKIRLLVQPEVPAPILEALGSGESFVAETVVRGDDLGRLTIRRDHEISSRLVDGVFYEAFPAPPKLIVIGAVPIAQALVTQAKTLGFTTIVADGRAAFATRERFPDADEVHVAWPEAAFRETGIDGSTHVCVLSHDPKFDEPALRIALRSDAAYVGAIGSKKTQDARRARLVEEGLSETEVARLHGPIGLDLGGREPAETALAILAQIVAVRNGRCE